MTVTMNETSNNNLAEFELNRAKRICGVGEYIKQTILPKFVETNAKGIFLEIGCGHGHWLTSYAKSDSQNIFVGIDIVSKRVRKADHKRELFELDNLFFLKVEAGEFLEALPSRLPILKTFIMYPDPWPKKRHFKKRIIQTTFLELLSEKSYSNSSLFFKTDHEGYFDWTTQVLKDSPHWILGKNNWPHDASSFFSDLFKISRVCSAKIHK